MILAPSRSLLFFSLGIFAFSLPPQSSEQKALASRHDTQQLEKQLSAALGAVVTPVPFTFSVQRADGHRYVFNSGASSLQASYESASTSKLVSAVLILRLVDQGYVRLSDRPQDHIPDWPIPSGDPLFGMNLDQLLSFTSGLTMEPNCLVFGGADFAECVHEIGVQNAGSGKIPGKEFYYSSTHLQVAGLMAMNAAGYLSWQALFTAFREETGLFSHSKYDIPSILNPHLAGGMHWTGEDYMGFLEALSGGLLLSPQLQALALSNQTQSAIMKYSPVWIALGEDWRYGYGLWNECESKTFTCQSGTRISSPGAYGSYPYWDLDHNYFGLLAQQHKVSGAFQEGIAIEQSVRPLVEAWAACK